MKINGKLIALFATVLLLLSIAMPTLAIDRHSGQDRYDTAVEISKGGWENGAEVVVLARGDIYADALVGVSLAYANNAPILLTKTDNLPQVTRDEIARLSPSKIYILGGTGAISQEIQDELQGMEIEVERISGDNRFDTAAKVAEMLVQNGADTAFLVYGLNFPDGVSAAAYAAQLGAPILFTHTDVLPEETMAALEALDPEHIFVIGGPAVISDDILDGLENVTRLYGANRYETSVALAERFAGNANKMYIAAGNDTSGGIDGITGAALAARMGTGLLLVGGTLSDEVEDFLASSVEEVFILGGASAVSPGLAEEIERAKDVRPDEPALDVLFYTGKNFCKSTSPIVSGEEVIQTIGKDGSITITIQDEAYIDSGFVIEVGTLGNLGSIEVEGSGDYGLNLYFDLDGDGQFFTWNGNEHIGLGEDNYALYKGPFADNITITDSSSFNLMKKGGTHTVAELKQRFGPDVPVGVWVGVTSPNGKGDPKTATIKNVTVTSPITPKMPVEFYTGSSFKKSWAPIIETKGKVTQTVDEDGSITITIQDEAYIDSGFVMEAGTLGDLGSIEVEGSGDYGLNLYFDLDGDGSFFTWNGNEYVGLGEDNYALYKGPFADNITITDSSSFNLKNVSGTHTVAELKQRFGPDVLVGVWVGVTSPNGNGDPKTATINNVTVTEANKTSLPVHYYTDNSFKRSLCPIIDGDGKVAQKINSDGSITITVKGETKIESGFLMEACYFDELGSITVEGEGEYYVNLYFDMSGDGEFFTWNDDGSFIGVGDDHWAADGGSSIDGKLVVNDDSSFEHRIYKKDYTVGEMKDLYGTNPLVGIWVGVDSMDTSVTIKSITITKAQDDK